MKTTHKIDILKAIAFIVLVISLFSYTSCWGPYNPPLQVTPIIQSVTNVNINSATLVATIITNKSSEVLFETKETASSNWESHASPLVYSVKGNILKVTFDFLGLKANTSYDFRIRLDKDIVSGIKSFETYAFADIDGNLYHTVTIGTQTWTKESLKVTHYRDGSQIPKKSLSNWAGLNSGAYCDYNNIDSLGDKYGHLYNYYAVSDIRNIAPTGWHVPIHGEWGYIYDYIGGYTHGFTLMSTSGWSDIISAYSPTNTTGFSALPGGALRVIMDSTDNIKGYVFDDLGYSVYFWTATNYGPNVVAAEFINRYCFLGINGLYRPNNGFSVRLIKDE